MCESVLAWALAHPGTEVRRLLPPGRVVKQPPRTIEPEVNDKFSAKEYPIPEKYLARLPGARLVSDLGLMVLPDGSFAAESIYGRSHLEAAPGYRAPLPAHPVQMAGDYYSLVIEYALDGNYYHWLHDVVLRLFGILEHLPSDMRFIVPPNLRPFQLESLALIGVGPQRLYPYDGTQAWELEHLYFSPPTVGSGGDSPAADAWLRALALQTYGIVPGPPHRRIYVSRRNARYRRILNEAEVEAYLAEHGFEAHLLENYSFREQVALFAEAEMVFAGHGAGHTNMIFAPPGLTVIDVFEPSEFNKCYWNMSEAVGHHYWYMCGETRANESGYAGDIIVPAAKLAEIVTRALAQRG